MESGAEDGVDDAPIDEELGQATIPICLVYCFSPTMRRPTRPSLVSGRGDVVELQRLYQLQ